MEPKDFLVIAIIVVGSGGILGGLAALLKVFFDRRSIDTTHKRRVKEALLKKIVEYVEKYYLPMLCESDGLAYSLKEKEKDERTFLYLCRYASRRLEVTRGMPGYFLRTRAGEAMVRRLEDEIYNDFTKSQECLSPIDWNQMAAMTSSHETWAEFQPKLEIEPLKGAFERFQKWRGDSNIAEKASIHLRCYIKFLEYEINEVLKDWYGKKPELVLEKTEKEEINNLIEDLVKDRELSSNEAKDLKSLLDKAELLLTE